MNRLIGCFLLAVLLLPGCNGTIVSSPPVFEVREFKMEREDSSSGWNYKGRGTLMTRAGSLQTGHALVFLNARKKSAKGKDSGPVMVFMSDGVGTLETYDFFSKRVRIGGSTIGDYESDPGAPEYEWEMLGYARLQSGTLATTK